MSSTDETVIGRCRVCRMPIRRQRTLAEVETICDHCAYLERQADVCHQLELCLLDIESWMGNDIVDLADGPEGRGLRRDMGLRHSAIKHTLGLNRKEGKQ